MANIKSSKKRIGVIERKTAKNKRIRTRIKDILKKFDAAIEAEDKEAAREMLALAEKKIMQASSKGTLHSNTASRKVSRLTKQFIKVFGVEALKDKVDTKKITEEKPVKAEEPEETIEIKDEPKSEESDAKKVAAPKKKSTKKESSEEPEPKE